ncbi:glutathione S-transferase family protein [Chondromyces crocatus]|uniref:Glutathione S-transferase n=1 Tax=Chondromyces crocatus TaxID=52 RepID=A0A0K1ECX0_CHOCO|nr:glutathione S-transferase N-terminal domain-containing protein [Chondromyces crocatus]AKT38542.1 glutathione S-transferase [Chondromyces crocatus]
MITLYTFTTPNGRKVSILLEELGLPYETKVIDISKGEQFDPAFLAVSPNNKIPALVDDDGDGGKVALFESGAILTYLAEKTGRFLPASGPARYETLAWLHWQIGGLGPMFGQLGFFGVFSKEKIPTAIKRYSEEADRLLGVMERRLASNTYLAGDDYSIADIAVYPWAANASTFLGEFLGESVAAKPAVRRWLENVGSRPAVQRGMAVPKV